MVSFGPTLIGVATNCSCLIWRGQGVESAHAVAAPLDPLLRIKAMRGNSIVATNRQRSDLSVALGLREGGRRGRHSLAHLCNWSMAMIAFEEFEDQWLEEIRAGDPSTTQLGNRFAQKVLRDWLEIDEAALKFSLRWRG